MKNLHSSLLVILCLVLFSCSENPNTNVTKTSIWPTIDSTTTFEGLLLPEGFSYNVLFSEGDLVYTKDTTSSAKGKHDCIVFLPDNNSENSGRLFVSHETRGKNTLLGDGGGATVFDVQNTNGKWEVISNFYNVDYSTVGGTFNNCGGKNTPLGTILTAEEAAPLTKAEITPYFSDLSPVNSIPKHLNFGYMVEVDPKNKTALRKLYQMGRFVHEDALALDDSLTVFLTQDDNPAIFWKFVADKKGEYESGQLYAYTEKAKDSLGHWIPMPMDMSSLFHITDFAIEKGATLYQRHEWMTQVGHKVYISETGRDAFDWNPFIAKGGVPGAHFNTKGKKGTYKDPYGRMLVYDMETATMEVLLEGGIKDNDSTFCFSNPDGLTSFQWKGKDYLFISEDIIGRENGRSALADISVNEAFLLDLSIENPTLDDLKRFAVGPKGCETTGGFISPDGKTLFLSIQHPNPDNPEPFNKSCVIAIKGF